VEFVSTSDNVKPALDSMPARFTGCARHQCQYWHVKDEEAHLVWRFRSQGEIISIEVFGTTWRPHVALDNHRNDDWKPRSFKTSDIGKT